jgi:hypothetical protein
MHPSKGVEKEYEVVLDKTFTSQDAALLKKGTRIEGSIARVEAVRQLAPNKIQIILHQGLKRQIRIMLGHLGYKVKRLNRTRLGPLTLRGVKPGSYRDLRKEDLEILRKALSAPKISRSSGQTIKRKLSVKGSPMVPLNVDPQTQRDIELFSDSSSELLIKQKTGRIAGRPTLGGITKKSFQGRSEANRPRKMSPTTSRSQFKK